MRTPRDSKEGAFLAPQRGLESEAKWMTLTWFLRPDRYEGEVVDGHMHGKGTYWHADSSRYEGSFCKSQRHGYGEYFFADGSCGDPRDIEERCTFYRYYKGEYKEGVKGGYGVFVYRDETRYEGTFQNNVKEGQGIMYYSDGSKYIGDYHNGMMDGQGEYVWPNGVKYVGEWRGDERHGFGQMFFSDHEPAYRARWDHDQRVFD
mmetsp:Transcript_23130/g.69286  ORF Transcript_23130/g.69286 Transcript_23130/m.69286 type:complete len:204 (-) Transcript_23130:271-882(-)